MSVETGLPRYGPDPEDIDNEFWSIANRSGLEPLIVEPFASGFRGTIETTDLKMLAVLQRADSEGFFDKVQFTIPKEIGSVVMHQSPDVAESN
jgi:hypothetical protein